MYFILVKPDQTGVTRQPFTREHSIYQQNLCPQRQSTFLLIFETAGEDDAFEDSKDNFLLRPITQVEYASLTA